MSPATPPSRARGALGFTLPTAQRLAGIFACLGANLLAGAEAHALTLTTELGRLPKWLPPGFAAKDTTPPATLKWAPPALEPKTLPTVASDDAAMATPGAHLAPTAAPATWPTLLSRLTESADQRAANADAQAREAVSRQQWAAAWMPRLDATANTTSQNQRYNGNNSQTPSSSTALTATLPVWRPAERAAARAQAASAEQARWQARGRQAALAQELSTAWLDGADAAEQLRLTQAHLTLLDTQLQANERRLQAGLGTVLDPLETRTRIAQVQAQADQLASRLRSQALVIERLTGTGAAVPSGLTPQAGNSLITLPELDEAMRIASERNPALQEAQAGARAASEQCRSRSAESWQPTVDATATASRVRQSQQFDGISEQQNVSTRAVGLALTWPLLTGGYQMERQREAAAQLGAAQARVDGARTRMVTGLRDAYQRLAQAESRLARLRTLVDSAQATQDALSKAWLAGLRNHTELLNSQQQLFEARLGLASARVAAMQASVDALSLLDWLDADHIAPLMGQFDF